MQYFVTFNSVALLLTLVVNVGLAIFILLRDPKSLVMRSFAYFLFSISVWTFGFLIFQNTKSLDWILFTRRLTPVGSSLIAGFFLLFSLVFPKEEKRLSPYTYLLVLAPGFVFSLLSVFSSLMINSMMITDTRYLFLGRVVYGPLYKLYAFYFIAFFLAALYNLLVKYLKAEGKSKLQIFYVLFGAAFSGGVGIALSLIMPMMGIAQFFTTGPFFTLVLVGFITYSIVKHRLLNIGNFLSSMSIICTIVGLVVGSLAIVVNGWFSLLFPFYIMVLMLFLGLLVLAHAPRSVANLSFFVMTIAVVAWSFSILRYYIAALPEQALFWALMANEAAVFIGPFFLLFTYAFPREEKQWNLGSKIIWFIPAIFLAISVYLRQVVANVISGSVGYVVVPGQMFFPYSLYLVLCFGVGFFMLIHKYHIYAGTIKIQIKYIFLGSFLSAVFALFTNAVLPFLGNSNWVQIGPYFTVFLIGFTAYAIVRHRLMSVEVFLQRGTVYAFATVLIMALYAFAVILSETFFRQVLGYNSVFITAFAAVFIAVAYQPLIQSFQTITDRLFFRGRYDYQKTLREISQKIAAVIKLEELTKLIVSSFTETMKVSDISFLLPEKEKEHFRSVALTIPRYKKIEIDVSSPIISWLLATNDILVREEIEDEIIRQESLGKVAEPRKRTLEEVRDEMDRLGISTWVPIISKDELIGVMALGQKLSGDIFSSEDLALLTTLANQAAVALDNARLYDEVVSMKNYNEEILQSMTNGVLTADLRGRVVTFNNMAEKITGRKVNDVLGKSCEDVWGVRGAITLAVDNTLKGRCCLNYEAGIASAERGLVPVSFSSTLLRDSHGSKTGALVSIQDLTEVKELEDKVRRADKLSALATMAAGMAHEIKNPLSSMKVFSQLLPKRFDDPEFRKKLEEILPREIDRIDKIVESLLGFARATAPTFVKVRIEEVIQETLDYFEDQAKNANVVIKKNYAELPEIEVDRGQISQVFSNLVLNAIQAMPDGGEVAVTTLPGKQVDGYLQNIKIHVTDTGHGMPEETQKKLFDPFFTTKYGGTGLGLTITHSIVDGHKGSIDVESKVGQGTTFIVTLPVSQGLI